VNGLDRSTLVRAAKVAAAVLAALLIVAAFFSYDVQSAILRLQRDTPEARVEQLMSALVEGNERAAFVAWSIPPHGYAAAALMERRSEVLRSVLARRPRVWSVERVEWWSMCCEPHIIDSPRFASGARYTIDIEGMRYRLDVFAMDHANVFDRLPASGWVVYDMYPADAKPLFNTFPGR
jgi:hypothetical protein